MSRPTTLLKDNTLYWVIRLYNDSQVLVDADSTPTVAVRKNDASVGDSVTVTKRAATTGIYDCEWNPSGEVEGDLFILEESATVSSVTYENSWSVAVEAAERGTNGANTTAPDNASIADILADTDELQSNQGDWATADTSLLSTQASVDAVQSTADNILADTDDLQSNQGQWLTADVSSLATQASVDALNDFDPATDTVANVTNVAVCASNTDMRGTNDALLQSNMPNNWPTLIVGTGVDAGKVTTSNPASGGGSAHTAEDVRDLILGGDKTPIAVTTGSVNNVILVDTTTDLTNGGSGGGDDAATIYAYFTDTGRPVPFQADVSGLSTFDSATDQVVASNFVAPDNAGIAANGLAIAALNDFNPATDVVARVTLVDTTTDLTNQSASGPTAQEIVDTWGNQPQGVYTTPDTLGFYLDAQVSTAGSGGSGLYQVTVTVQDSNLNVLQGARINVDGTTLTLTTDSSGQVVFNLDSGVYTLSVSPPAGYDTPVGQVVTVTSSDTSSTFTLNETNPGGDDCDVPWIG